MKTTPHAQPKRHRLAALRRFFETLGVCSFEDVSGFGFFSDRSLLMNSPDYFRFLHAFSTKANPPPPGFGSAYLKFSSGVPMGECSRSTAAPYSLSKRYKPLKGFKVRKLFFLFRCGRDWFFGDLAGQGRLSGIGIKPVVRFQHPRGGKKIVGRQHGIVIPDLV
jgi:hypothetical protein